MSLSIQIKVIQFLFKEKNKKEVLILNDIYNDLETFKVTKKKIKISPNKRKFSSVVKIRNKSKSVDRKRDNSFNTYKSIPIKINETKISFEKVNYIKDEIKNANNILQEIKMSVNEKCVLHREKQNYTKVQNQIIKAYSVIETLKENIVNFKYSLKSTIATLDSLEKENIKLKTDYNNLTLYAKTKRIKMNDFFEDDPKDPIADLMDFSLLQNSSFEMNTNMKRNQIDGKASNRIYVNK